MKSHNIRANAAKTFGISFLIGYISYGFGFGFLNHIMQGPDFLITIHYATHQVMIEAGILMAIFAPVNIVLGIIMTPIFKARHQELAYGYLGAAIASTVLLIVGAVFLLLLIPLSNHYSTATPEVQLQDELLALLLKQANFYCYQIAMVIWGLGGFILSYLLLKMQLVPKWLAVWGIIGYVIFVSGAFFALFGIPIDVLLDIPGGLFELFLSVWLIIKGFKVSENTTSPVA